MQYSKTDHEYVLILDKGDEVAASITSFCKEQNIQNGYFRGIGAIDHLECGYYALDEKRYYFSTYNELCEVASLTGNITQKEGAPFVHMHGIFTDTTNNAFGGHVKEMCVGVTLEIILTPLSSAFERHHDEEIGLFLINCAL